MLARTSLLPMAAERYSVWRYGASFLLGMSLGVLGLLSGQRWGLVPGEPANPEQFRQQYTRMMQSRLALQPEQREKLESILNRTRDRFGEVQTQYKPAFQAIRDEQYQEIRRMLTDQQRAEYEKIRAERFARNRRPAP